MIKASIILLIATVIQNVGNYAYHFSMGRLLEVEEYGMLGSLFSVLMIATLPSIAIVLSLAKFVSILKAKSEYGKIKYLYQVFFKWLGLVGVLLTLLFLIITPVLQNFLKIDAYLPVFLILFTAIVAIFKDAFLGFIDGLQLFNIYSLQTALVGVLKFSFGIVLVLLGLNMGGAILGITITFMIFIVWFFLYLRKVFKDKTSEKYEIGFDFIKYGLPVFVANLFMMIIFSSDLLIIPRFFSQMDLGFYNSAATLGRTIYYFPGMLVWIMFPLVAESQAKEHKTNVIFFKAIAFSLGMALIGAAIFYFSSDLMIKLLYGEKYLPGAGVLKFFGFALIPMSLLNVIINYELAKKRLKFIWILMAGVIIQLAMFFMYHDSFYTILKILFLVSFIMIVLIVVLNRITIKVKTNESALS